MKQNIDPNRYKIIPRSLTFLRHEDEILLIRHLGADHPWIGKFNGIGGHIEVGEDPLSAAKREVHEESGLEPIQIRLCGVIHINIGENHGIGLYVFMGNVENKGTSSSSEGEVIWVPFSKINTLPVLEDVPSIIEECMKCYNSSAVFSWAYRFDSQGGLIIERGDSQC